jgi:tRNA-uridine 2-sulfurtransferase
MSAESGAHRSSLIAHHRGERVLVAMSGGVDSSVAAALLKEQGYDVVGVTMRLYEETANSGVRRSEFGVLDDGGRGCCGFTGSRDAARVAAKLGFPHYTWDFRKEFATSVIDNFCTEYGRGRTPNPCLRCNEVLKFTELLNRAPQLGADFIATGHYARITPKTINDERGTMNEESWQLLKGADASKDQSYFLYAMTQEQLAKVLMPVGALTKAEVREKARKLDLPVAEKAESQDICFVPDGDYAAFLRRRRPELFRPGPVLDLSGRILGEHDGIVGFTMGQRKGLGLAFGERRYVVRLDLEKNAVVLGTENEVRTREVEAGDVRWVSGSAPAEPFRAHASVRYQSKGGDALVDPVGSGRVRVTFDEPQWAPTPGQAVVFWQGDCCIGGATIECSARE